MCVIEIQLTFRKTRPFQHAAPCETSVSTGRLRVVDLPVWREQNLTVSNQTLRQTVTVTAQLLRPLLLPLGHNCVPVSC